MLVKILRTILLVVLAFVFLIFAIYNWQPVELTLWQNLVLETKVPVLAIVAFVAGFGPMWALHRSVVWGLNRRIRALESSLKNNVVARRRDIDPVTPAPAATALDSPAEKTVTATGEAADASSSTSSPFSIGADGGGK